MHYFGLVSPRPAYGIYERDLAAVLDPRGQSAEAATHYAALAAAWANADPELQRHVEAARTRLSELKSK
jgi:hypothetical protein